MDLLQILSSLTGAAAGTWYIAYQYRKAKERELEALKPVQYNAAETLAAYLNLLMNMSGVEPEVKAGIGLIPGEIRISRQGGYSEVVIQVTHDEDLEPDEIYVREKGSDGDWYPIGLQFDSQGMWPGKRAET